MSEESEIWDAIVIGGGPAGSTTARYIAEGGKKVLVLDGRDSIGSPLQCGELVPTNDEMRRLCPDVPDIDVSCRPQRRQYPEEPQKCT